MYIYTYVVVLRNWTNQTLLLGHNHSLAPKFSISCHFSSPHWQQYLLALVMFYLRKTWVSRNKECKHLLFGYNLLRQHEDLRLGDQCAVVVLLPVSAFFFFNSLKQQYILYAVKPLKINDCMSFKFVFLIIIWKNNKPRISWDGISFSYIHNMAKRKRQDAMKRKKKILKVEIWKVGLSEVDKLKPHLCTTALQKLLLGS